MIAVCGIGNPSGLRNSATTAYQSARPPIVAASANAATKPKTGCTGSNIFAVTNSASVPVNTSVASTLTRRSSAARAASPGASNEKVPDVVMAALTGTNGFDPSLMAPSPSWPGLSRTSPGMTQEGQKEGPLQAGL